MRLATQRQYRLSNAVGSSRHWVCRRGRHPADHEPAVCGQPEYTFISPQGAKWYPRRVMRSGAGPTGARYNSMWRYKLATTLGVYPDQPAGCGAPAEGRDVAIAPAATHNSGAPSPNTGWGNRPHPPTARIPAILLPEPPSIVSASPPGDRAQPAAGEQPVWENLGRRGAPGVFQAVPADGVPADCRWGVLATAISTTPRARQRVQSANGQAGAHRRSRSARSPYQPDATVRGAVHRRQSWSPPLHPGIRYDNLFAIWRWRRPADSPLFFVPVTRSLARTQPALIRDALIRSRCFVRETRKQVVTR